MLFHRCVDYDSMAPRYLALDIVSTCIMGVRAEQLTCANYHRLGKIARAGEQGSRARNTGARQCTFCYLAIAHSHSLPTEPDLLRRHTGHAFPIIICLLPKAGHMAC